MGRGEVHVVSMQSMIESSVFNGDVMEWWEKWHPLICCMLVFLSRLSLFFQEPKDRDRVYRHG